MRLHFLALLALLALVALSPVANAQAPSDTAALRREVERVARAMEDAVARGDLEGAAAYYADDAIVRTARGIVAQGRAGIDQYFTGIAGARSWKLDVNQVGGTADAPWWVGRSTLVHGTPERQSIVQFLVLLRRLPDGKLRVVLDYYHSAER